MSLADFEHAEATEGKLYELSRGVVVVSDVPGRRHLAQVSAIRDQLYAYRFAHPGQTHTIAARIECQLLVADMESERHPDLAVYKTPPPGNGAEMWWSWIPELVIEVVSPGSVERDYVLKREEYLALGVREYRIVDADRGEMLVLRRWRGRWAEQVVRPPEVYRTRLLPGLEFAIGPVFQAAAG
jgi:Uma2 family endonuclease